MGQNDVTQKDMDWLEGLTQTKNTLTELYGKDVSKRVIAMGVKDRNLTNKDLRALANKELTERQTGMEKDFLTTGTGIDKGDITLTAETFENKYLHPDSIPNYSRAELNFAHRRHNSLVKKEIDRDKTKYNADVKDLNIEKKEIKEINEKLLNLKDASDFTMDMNIGIFDELGRLIRKPLGILQTSDEIEGNVGSAELGALYEGGSDISDIVKEATPGLNVEREEVEREEGESTEDWSKRQGKSREDWSKRQKEPTEQYQERLSEYKKNYELLGKLESTAQDIIFNIGHMAGQDDMSYQKEVNAQILEKQGYFLRELEGLINQLTPEPGERTKFLQEFPGEDEEEALILSKRQNETDDEWRIRVYGEFRDKFQIYLGQLNQKHEHALGKTLKNPWLQYRVD
jgi:hypothetical protein